MQGTSSEASSACSVGHVAPVPSPLPRLTQLLSQTSELVLYVKMGLVFRLEVQVGAAILVEDPAGRVANNGVLGFVHLAEDVIEGLQLLGSETRLGEKKWER